MGTDLAVTAALKSEDEVWIIRFDDADRGDEVFAGYGATEAALRRFEMVQGAWNSGLFRCVAKNLTELDGALGSRGRPIIWEFQDRVEPWLLACFGEEIANDATERNHRFLEEAIELVQACGTTKSEAHQLVDYVFGRPVGEQHQEVGGVMVTLAALCRAWKINMHEAGDTELARIWTKVEKIRAKQAAKPKHSPLPEVSKSETGWLPIEDADQTAELLVNDTTGSEPEMVAARYLSGEQWSGWVYADELLSDSSPLGPCPTHYFVVPPVPRG